MRGNVLVELERYEEAMEQFRKALALDPAYAPAHVGLGNALGNLNQDEEAMEQFQKALALDPTYAPAHNSWANLLGDKDRHEEAIKHYKDAIALDPSYTRSYINWGIALSEMERYEEAIEKFKEAVKLDSTDVDAYINWGRALNELEYYEEGLQVSAKAVELDSENADAHSHLGTALISLNHFKEAIEEYQRASTSPKDVNYQTHVYSSFNIADIYMTQGRYREAWEEFRKTREGFEANSHNGRTHRDSLFFCFYADLLRSIFGCLDEAELAYREGLNYNKDEEAILMGLVELYLEKKDNAPGEQQSDYHWKAIAVYKNAKNTLEKENAILKNRLLQESKSQRSIHLAQASNYLELGKLETMVGAYGEAEKNLGIALELNPNLKDAHNQLGVVLTKNEQFRGAISSFEEAKRQNIHDLTIRSNLAETNLKAGMIDQAENEYRAVLSIAPQNIESLIGMGELQLARGEKEEDDVDLFEEAIRYFSKALKLAGVLNGSKRLTTKEVALVHYLRGYARIKLFETSKIKSDESLLWKARNDFAICFNKDQTNHKALRSRRKIEKRLWLFMPRRIGKTLGAVILLIASIFVFVISQSAFYFHRPDVALAETTYVLLTFGSLFLFVAGIFLPQLLKLKIAGIELEKSTVDQIQTTERLGIRK